MLSRKIFEECGAFRSETYPEDYDLTFRFYEHKIPIVSIQKELHIWRDHSQRASRNDVNYSDNSFLDIKTAYFLKLDLNETKQLVLWGAGKKSKKIAQLLLKNKVQFVWACNNPNKINHSIYDIIMEDIDMVFQNRKHYQTIITIANKEQQTEIKRFLDHNIQIEPFWFC